jgi:hypothetical protein
MNRTLTISAGVGVALLLAAFSLAILIEPYTAAGRARDALSSMTPDELASHCGKPVTDQMEDDKNLESRTYQIRTLTYQTSLGRKMAVAFMSGDGTWQPTNGKWQLFAVVDADDAEYVIHKWNTWSRDFVQMHSPSFAANSLDAIQALPCLGERN